MQKNLFVNAFFLTSSKGSTVSNGTGAVSLNITTVSEEKPDDFEFYTDVVVRFKKFSRQKCASETRLNLLEFNVFGYKKRSGSMDLQLVLDTITLAEYSHYCFDHVINPKTGIHWWILFQAFVTTSCYVLSWYARTDCYLIIY
jgi:hypothetical protein